MELLNAWIETQHFAGRVMKETTKAIMIKGNTVTNWIPKSIFWANATCVGKAIVQDYDGEVGPKSESPTMEVDSYQFDIPFWMDVKKEPQGYAF